MGSECGGTISLCVCVWVWVCPLCLSAWERYITWSWSVVFMMWYFKQGFPVLSSTHSSTEGKCIYRCMLIEKQCICSCYLGTCLTLFLYAQERHASQTPDLWAREASSLFSYFFPQHNSLHSHTHHCNLHISYPAFVWSLMSSSWTEMS